MDALTGGGERFAVLLALLAAVCFGAALVVGQCGLRHASPLAGGTVSVTSTVVAWLAISPAFLDLSGRDAGALALFAGVGIFYPAIVMVLTYESNRRLGPTLTGAAASTSPLFAAAAAVIGLGERLSYASVVGGGITVLGLALLALRSPMRAAPGWCLLLPLSGAALRGLAQTLIKLGLVLWPSPFGAALVCYLASAAVMWGAGLRAPGRMPRYTRAGIAWFVAVGFLNGSAVLLSYHALKHGTVAVVSTVVATYPLFTMLFSAAFLRSETLTPRTLTALALVIAGVATVVKA